MSTPAVDPLLRLAGVHAYIGESHILQGVDFAVAPNRVTVLLGRNGAGKTTTLRTILGLVPAASGTITFDGVEIGTEKPHHVVRRGVGYVPEDRDVFAGLTVAQNLRLAQRPGASRERWALAHALFPDLERRADQRAGSLSGGQQQMVAIARALVNDNRLLLVDEPSKGLAPVVVAQVTEALAAIKGTTTILLVEQNLAMAQALADDAVVLDDGRVVYTGPMAELAADEALQTRYLGAGGHATAHV
ncbi:MAG: Putative branched-chain amino acid ABC transporter, ATP-binding protein [uncultured Thermomicrobiales bacterium]|uniref:Branched-chain amino acid ABC transporter, ATP-binding protein n=1 Tax=uncultured Thermomicrobiales bacterium TaxID=1645740 RepID=A0A6J4U4L9_9BACT|nr:MAG: Putative branched-chain amino acid ABC transporter, ATP-binding protein [uncultured Thermomicrobiales bacterium]